MSDAGKLKVLVVDDEELIALALSRYLTTKNYNVVATTSPEKGLSFIRGEKFDIVILDISMKPIDGIELVKELRKHDKRCKIILISATITWDEIKKRLEGFNVDEFIEKPFELCYIHEKLIEMTK